MPLPAPMPLDALRQHTRAVILTAEGCDLSDDVRGLAAASGVRCEVVDHPLMAVAALASIERESKAAERAALVIAGRQIDDLAPLFSTARSRLPRVSIWVFEADLAIEVQRGHADPESPANAEGEAPSRVVAPSRPSLSAAPTLRIAGTGDDAALGREAIAPPRGAGLESDHGKAHGRIDAEVGDVASDPAEDPPGPSGNTVTPEELELLLDMFDGDGRPNRGRGDQR